jgi:hypothetical protein
VHTVEFLPCPPLRRNPGDFHLLPFKIGKILSRLSVPARHWLARIFSWEAPCLKSESLAPLFHEIDHLMPIAFGHERATRSAPCCGPVAHPAPIEKDVVEGFARTGLAGVETNCPAELPDP